MSDLMIGRAGNRVFVTGVVLLCIWVLLPIWLLFVNALSAPSEVTAFPKSLIPSFDLASLSFFFGFAEVLDALWNSVQVPGRPDQRDERRRIVQAADLVVVYRNPARRRINKNAIPLLLQNPKVLVGYDAEVV